MPSAFVHINLYVDTSLLNSDERAWLEVYLEIMFEVAVEKDDGTILSHSKVRSLLLICFFALWKFLILV